MNGTTELMKKPLMEGAFLNKNHSTADVLIQVDFGASQKNLLNNLKGIVFDWQLEKFSTHKVLQKFDTPMGPLYLLLPFANPVKEGILPASEHVLIKKAMGLLLTTLEHEGASKVQVEFKGGDKDYLRSAFCGLEIAAYSYKSIVTQKQMKMSWAFTKDKGKISKEDFDRGLTLGQAVNIARHVVNIPPNILNPTSYSRSIEKFFKNKPGFKVNIWNKARLQKENMQLILAVGAGSEHPPCMIHLSYRPTGSKNKKPMAFVGKGITYDTGGLNLKPGGSMRNMKKDMGGSAALLGLAFWAERSKSKTPMDFYFAIAENSVDERSFRPGDILVSRKGISVEIDNTDAEGRLVLADALDVAQKQKPTPSAIVNMATLTGAIKIALGKDIAGLFCTDDTLQNKLCVAGVDSGDLVWPMPMYEPYNSRLQSSVADVVNSSDSFGSSITAALFLRKFVENTPFAHVDIYSWVDSPQMPLKEPGGSGQGVELLVNLIN